MAYVLNKLPIEVARLIASLHVPHRTRGYPVACVCRDTEPGDDDGIDFDRLTDSEQEAVLEWYREGMSNASSPHQRWRALMDEREGTRIQINVEIVRSRINALASNNATLLFDGHMFCTPIIQNHGSLLACGRCGHRLPRSEEEYLRKPQRIYCTFCTQTLAERTEIRSQPHPSKGYAPLLRVPGKRDFVFVHTRLPGQ